MHVVQALQHFEQLSNAETAQVLGLQENTAPVSLPGQAKGLRLVTAEIQAASKPRELAYFFRFWKRSHSVARLANFFVSLPISMW